MKRKSYGTIPVCVATGRTLLTQRKDTPEFLCLLKGHFKESDITYILSESFKQEHDVLRSLLRLRPHERRIKHREILLSLYREGYVNSLLDTAVKMINKYADSIRAALDMVIPRKEAQWLWPKGRPERGEGFDTTALRETYEEAGVKVPRDCLLSSTEPLKLEAHSFLGQTFETSYYLAFLPQEIAIDRTKIDRKEVSNVEWVPLSELREKLDRSYHHLIDDIYKHLPAPDNIAPIIAA